MCVGSAFVFVHTIHFWDRANKSVQACARIVHTARVLVQCAIAFTVARCVVERCEWVLAFARKVGRTIDALFVCIQASRLIRAVIKDAIVQRDGVKRKDKRLIGVMGQTHTLLWVVVHALAVCILARAHRNTALGTTQPVSGISLVTWTRV